MGIAPLAYFAVSIGSLAVFARNRRFQQFLLTISDNGPVTIFRTGAALGLSASP